MGYFRCQMKMVQAISMLKGPGAMQALEEQAFRPGEDSATFDGIVAAFQLWDRIGADARPAVQALGSSRHPDGGPRGVDAGAGWAGCPARGAEGSR